MSAWEVTAFLLVGFAAMVVWIILLGFAYDALFHRRKQNLITRRLRGPQGFEGPAGVSGPPGPMGAMGPPGDGVTKAYVEANVRSLDGTWTTIKKLDDPTDDPSFGWHAEYLKDQALNNLRSEVEARRAKAMEAITHRDSYSSGPIWVAKAEAYADVLALIKEEKDR